MVLRPSPCFRLVKVHGRSPRIRWVSPRHHLQRCAHIGGKVGFIDHQEIGFGDPRSAFARDLLPFGHIDDVDGQIRQLRAEGGAQVIAAAFHEDKVEVTELFTQRFHGGEVH